jgi:pyrophosphatase PpaX
LFDLDGTLLDTKELILSSFRYATREVLGEQLPDEAVLSYVGIPLREQAHIFAPGHVEEMLTVYREHNARVHDDLVRYFEGTREMLDELRAEGRRLAVVTSKRNGPAVRGLAHFDLEGYFEFVIGSEDTATHKPEPEPLLLGAERLGLLPSDCVYVGDSPFDMQAAKAAGIVAVGALWGMFTRAQLLEAGAQYEAAAPCELPATIRKAEA